MAISLNSIEADEHSDLYYFFGFQTRGNLKRKISNQKR